MRRLLLFILLPSLWAGCRRERTEVKSDPAAAPPKRVVCSIPEEDPIVTVVEVPARCDLAIKKSRHIGRGGTLAIAPGAKLAFVKGAALIVEGGSLVARGTKEEPVTFGSASEPPAPGDWVGLRFPNAPPPAPSGDAGTADAGAAGSTLEHFVVEHAGQKLDGDTPAAIAIGAWGPKSVRFDHGRIRKNAATGLRIATSGILAGAEDLTFADNGGFSAEGSPVDIASFVAPTFDEPVRLLGNVRDVVVLPNAPAYVIRRLLVQGSKAPASLTFPEGTIVKFERGGGIDLGFALGGGTPSSCTLVAKKVTFTSAEKPPAAGDWIGLALHDGCAATIEDATVEYAGDTPGKTVRGGIEIPTDDKSISVLRTTFKNLKGPAFTAETSCAPWIDSKKANVYAGGKLCEGVPSPIAGILAALGSTSSLSSAFGDGGLGIGSFGELDGPGSGFGVGGLGMAGAGGLGTGSSGVIGGGGASSPAKVKEVSVTTTGKLPNEVVRRILRANIARLRACYGSSKLSGTISAQIDIDAKGSVTKATSTGGTLTDATIVSCVTSVLRSVSFPEPESGTVTSNATWDFQPP
ncbi:MAG: AgmX/PglI C-terminal domain-containing protein [Polyangiales bacterium]